MKRHAQGSASCSSRLQGHVLGTARRFRGPPPPQVAGLQSGTVCCVQDELPEQTLGTVRLEHLDLTCAAHFDAETGAITRKA